MGQIQTAAGTLLHTEVCCNCSTVFAMTEIIYQERLKDGKMFYCPNGHGQYYTDNELSRTKKALEQKERELESQKKRTAWEAEDAKQQRERANREERRGRSLKGHQTRLRKRLADGQCPCCEQTFEDLQKHIASKHPRYKPKDES